MMANIKSHFPSMAASVAWWQNADPLISVTWLKSMGEYMELSNGNSNVIAPIRLAVWSILSSGCLVSNRNSAAELNWTGD